MLIALKKRKVTDMPFSAILDVEEITKSIKNVKLKQNGFEVLSPEKGNSYLDVDFFFVILEHFMKFNLKTKKVFLTHF